MRSDDPDLTSRQMSVVLSVYMTDPPHTVRGLAADLNLAKPVITRALDTLSKKGLVKRAKDDRDGRSIVVARTVKGAVFLSELSDRIVAADKSVPTNSET